MIRKTFSLMLILFVFSSTSKAQYSLKLSQFRPTNETGFVYNKSIAFEIGKRDLFEDFRRSYISVGYASLSPRQESIRTLSSYYGGTGGYVIQQVDVYFSNQNVFSLDGGMHFSPMSDNSILKLYGGLGVALGYYSFSSEEYYENGMQKSSESLAFVTGGVKPSVGLEVNPNDRVIFFVEGVFAFLLDSEKQYLRNNQIGIGVTINLE